ncbi:hypothetical protein [Paenibacillus sp. B2(2019)]|uniref:hypothetical protein n=1 Tax=Paenibacillus sp. B2(2019) TaxID=2607754 RepID=UPI0011F3BD5D|nr:hypothetical protein [Paenibacillus sp. B2(2019)]KAA1180662.1 hypothetical protein PAENI_25760 [Paenibacillus sp. B2(2019)]
MNKHMIAADLREEIVFWKTVEDDALLRGGEIDLNIYLFAARYRRECQDRLLQVWDEIALDEFRNNRLNEKQPTGVGAGELSITRQNILTLN